MEDRIRAAFKRGFDIVAASFLFILLVPLFVAVALFIKFDSVGPVFYRGVRTGLNGKPFRIYKFRTMVPNAEALGGPSTALNDPRLTRVGKVLRRYKFDEFPQLINIVLGHMSVVGPRPQVERYTRLYRDEERIILTVRPGLTDYASVKFICLDKLLGDDRVDEKYMREIEPEKTRLRIRYVREQSLWNDCKILFDTVRTLLQIRSSWNTRD